MSEKRATFSLTWRNKYICYLKFFKILLSTHRGRFVKEFDAVLLGYFGQLGNCEHKLVLLIRSRQTTGQTI